MNNLWFIRWKKSEMRNKNSREIMKNLNRHGIQNYNSSNQKIMNRIHLERIK
jgi:hypothetical protein